MTKQEKGRQQKRRLPQPNFAAPKHKNSFKWQYIFHKTFLPNQIDHNTTPSLNSDSLFNNINLSFNAVNLAIAAALKDFHDTTNKTPHNNHAEPTS